MGISVNFVDNSMEVSAALDDCIKQFLTEAAGEIQAETARQSPVDTGQLKNSWTYHLEETKATVGSDIQNAIWNEFGTGEYAAAGNGRKGGWRYKDRHGAWHFTHGKAPRRTLQTAFDTKRELIIARAKEIFGGLGK